MRTILEHTRLDLALRSVPSEFDGFRITFLSDLHFYGVEGRLEESVVETVTTEDPDLLIMGGDAINAERYWPALLDYLARLEVTSPKFCVPGNWEYRRAGGTETYARWMQQAGFEDISNKCRTIERNGQSINVAGLDDPRHGRPSEGAFPDNGLFSLAVCHSPDVLLILKEKPFNLLLCGHTHGGQVCLPFIGPLFTATRLGRKFVSGLHELEPERYVYISRGVGSGIPHTRINCPAEIVTVTLRMKSVGEDGNDVAK